MCTCTVYVYLPTVLQLTCIHVHVTYHYNYACSVQYMYILSPFLRSPGADFLVGNGPSKTWLLGNSLVTITTSGTGGGSSGECPRCKILQRSLQPNPDVLLASNESYLSTFRRMSMSSDQGELETTPPLCSCWCRGWCEIKVRRPTGNVAWLMRVQNKLDILATSTAAGNVPGSNPEYDMSLMGINTAREREELFEESGWDFVDLDRDESHDLSHNIRDESHDRREESHDHREESHDHREESHDHRDESHDQSLDFSVDLSKPDPQFHFQLHDLTVKSHDQSHDHTIRSHEHSSESHDSSLESHDHSSDQLHKFSASPKSHEHSEIKRILALKQQESVTIRQPSSHSWSEGRAISISQEKEGCEKPRDHKSARSYSVSSSSVELLPPLFSYDEDSPMSRSPSLLRDDGPLSDPEQVLYTVNWEIFVIR